MIKPIARIWPYIKDMALAAWWVMTGFIAFLVAVEMQGKVIENSVGGWHTFAVVLFLQIWGVGTLIWCWKKAFFPEGWRKTSDH